MCTIEKDGRYTYYICDNKVVCVSSFAKKKIKGIAKCSPNDTFDIEIGKQLSRSRCDLKIATKRYAKAHNLLIEKLKEISNLQEEKREIHAYEVKAYDTYIDALYKLEHLSKNL